ncbi:Zn(2)-C6 fungal-type domain-containing protein [Trichoderma simmonsii]|uniref:Zn(2)-C6 fungal-type domain-containing protein n=1 Tax=Trichoderma simmonsii TaxID=1491479 RepID=A0A8G0L3U5_9HYPO|nr:Zn(2)-C6 fungal-type domain-containing protein [Trichoderma simmonsii]
MQLRHFIDSLDLFPMSAQVPLTLKAQRPCRYCASRKQGCDRLLPNCSRCTSKFLTCNYSVSRDGHVIALQNEAPVQKNDLVEIRGSCSPDLSTKGESLLFRLVCDSDREDGEYDGASSLSELLFKTLGAFDIDIPNLLDSYFASVHRWLPVLREEDVRQKCAHLENDKHGHVARLLLTFYVVVQFPCDHAAHSMNTRLYRTLKRLFVITQSSPGIKDLDLLQYGLLLGAYECSQGLESAYNTLNLCVSLARMVEVQSYKSNALDSKDPEERLLCGYALVALDRLIAVSSMDYCLPLLLPDPQSFPLIEEHDLELDEKLKAYGYTGRMRITATVARLVSDTLTFLRCCQLGRTQQADYVAVDSSAQDSLGKLLRLSENKAFLNCEPTSMAIR